ncbi:hypothetical protein DL95DRAFT_469066 [Leptodontidium sp. 2 PMI_412]|nr:hypothetical protein DL95DRAFT_469066 [Leptodontidium sp. 2 PMI_412]
MSLLSGALTGGRQVGLGVFGDAKASCGGHGTLEILEVTKILEKEGIPCCIVGVSALKYYWAQRMRNDWEIRVPTEHLEKSLALLTAEPYDQKLEICQHLMPQIESLLRTFPRFKFKGVNLWFDLIPSDDAHVVCEASNFERSSMGLPYPKLEVFAQSLLDTHSRVALNDLVDGMDLPEEWGEENLDLSGTVDLPWAERKNKKIKESVENSWMLLCSNAAFSTREIWEEVVGGKTGRIGLELPESFITRGFAIKAAKI